MVHQVRGAFRHPAASATPTHRSAFAAEGDQPLKATVAAAKTREPAREPPAPQEGPEFLFHEPGQAVPLPQAGGLGTEGLEVIAHHLVHNSVGGHPGLVRRRWTSHARQGACGVPGGTKPK